MGELVRWKPNIEISRRIEEALAIVEATQPPVQKAAPAPPARVASPVTVLTQNPPPVVALARVCAVTGKPFMSYYMHTNAGRFRYSRSGQVTKAVFRELFAGPGIGSVRFNNRDIEEETCPWCGTSGRGGISCSQCHSFTCWGAVIDNLHSRCPVCGIRGELSRKVVEQMGVIPAAE